MQARADVALHGAEKKLEQADQKLNTASAAATNFEVRLTLMQAAAPGPCCLYLSMMCIPVQQAKVNKKLEHQVPQALNPSQSPFLLFRG